MRKTTTRAENSDHSDSTHFGDDVINLNVIRDSGDLVIVVPC